MANLNPAFVPASFGGVPFFVTEDSLKAGVRVAPHEYPMRSTPYSEPLGRAARRYLFTGFLIGDDVQQQLNSLLAVIETSAAQTLVHPLYGSVQAIALNETEIIQTTAANYIEIRFVLIEAGNVATSPSTGADTQAATTTATTNATAASQSSFTNDVTPTVANDPTTANLPVPTNPEPVQGGPDVSNPQTFDSPDVPAPPALVNPEPSNATQSFNTQANQAVQTQTDVITFEGPIT